MGFFGWVVILVFALICGGLTKQVANSKGWEDGWFFGGLFFGPIALLAACGLPDKKLRNYVRALAKKLEALEDINSQGLFKNFDPELVSLLDQKLISKIIPSILKSVDIDNSKILPNEIHLKDKMNYSLIKAYRSRDSSEWLIKFQRAF